jgi:hypothetical protein
MKLPDAPILEKVRQWLAYADEDSRVAHHGLVATVGAVLTAGSHLDNEGIAWGNWAREKPTVRKTLTVATHSPCVLLAGNVNV